MLSLGTNLAELPLRASQLLANSLKSNDTWTLIIEENSRSSFYLSKDDFDRYRNAEEIGNKLLTDWGNRGETVVSLLTRLQNLYRLHGSKLDIPQLVLGRMFKNVRWSNDEQILMGISGDDIKLECTAIGFPWPSFQWYYGNDAIEGATTPILLVPRCNCQTEFAYCCEARNMVPTGYSFSDAYRKPNKQFSSKLKSKDVDIKPSIGDFKCSRCEADEIGILKRKYGSIPDISDEVEAKEDIDVDSNTLIAADKVALIISNCMYDRLPKLGTPLSDAETLAQALQDMHYKTVTLADLNLEEMKKAVLEYKKLLGTGVYAVFYFVGHGFEVHGQCYLLPVDAPADAHHPKYSLSMDWILEQFLAFTPALNLILLDICRKLIPFEDNAVFDQYAEHFNRKKRSENYRGPRNMVYGYSTSGGVGAYEVRGEINGIFMKYMKEHVHKSISVTEVLYRVSRDIEDDEKVGEKQIPEIRSTLTRPRSLTDPLIYDGHTTSFDSHTYHWRLIHQLPDPTRVNFQELGLTVTILCQFCFHFTNKVYVFSSVSDYEETEDDQKLTENALNHRAYLSFPEGLETSNLKEIDGGEEEGVSIYVLLSHLQRSKGPLRCRVDLKHKDDPDMVVATSEAVIGDVLITRLRLNE